MAEKKYLDETGLGRVWIKIKEYIATQYGGFAIVGTGLIQSTETLIMITGSNVGLKVSKSASNYFLKFGGNSDMSSSSVDRCLEFSQNKTHMSKFAIYNGLVKLDFDKHPVAATPLSSTTGSMKFGIYVLDNNGEIDFRPTWTAIKSVSVIAICNTIKFQKVTSTYTFSFGSSYANCPVIIMSYVNDGSDITDGN